MSLNLRTTTIKESEKGAVLLVTILILAGLMLISFAVATLAQRDIRASSDIKRGEAAFYAADSALEETLYRLKNGAELTAVSLDSYKDFITGEITNVQYTVALAEGEDELRAGSLLADETDQIDISIVHDYDVENDIFVVEPHNLDEINVKWSSSTGGWLEWTVIRWPQNEQMIPFNLSDFEQDATDDFNNNETNVTLFKNVEPPEAGSDSQQTDIRLDKLDYDPLPEFNHYEYNYILRLKALYGDISYEVTTTTNTNESIIPGITNIQAVGLVGENKRAIEISVNKTRGAAGFTDFVLYSDETLDKF